MIGRTLSHYRITEKLGEGGMGVVYKAEDTKLRRTVALKFLHADAIEDAEAKERFLREAQAAAGLDHPNICTVYEIDEVEGETFLAMAYVEGRTVKDKIRDRPLKLEAAIDIAVQTAEGLKAAHQKGVVHRDIKAANLMLTEEGQVKIMDFGLALLAEQSRLTKTSTILGTPAYMSPEQAERRPTDRRTDTWSLGVVIYEMVTGRLPFAGERQEAVLYAISNQEPEPVTALRAGLPMELEFIVGKALAKDPADRYQHVEEMIVDLRALKTGPRSPHGLDRTSKDADAQRIVSAPTPRAVQQPTTRISFLVPWALLAVAVVTLLAMWLRWPDQTQEKRLRRFAFTPEENAVSAAISPNSRHIAYVVGNGDLWIQDLDRQKPRKIADGAHPFAVPCWAPTSESIAYREAGELKRISVEGGPATTLCPLPNPLVQGCSWSPDGGSIAFSPGGQGVYEVSALGGSPKMLIEPQERAFIAAPHFTPVGSKSRGLLYVSGSLTESQIVLRHLAAGDEVALTRGAGPVFSSSGHVLHYASYGSTALFGLPVSSESLTPEGESFPILKDAPSVSVSANGTLVYVDRNRAVHEQLVWRDRGGRILTAIGEPELDLSFPSLSPDEQFIAVSIRSPSGTDVWIHDLTRSLRTRFTLSPAGDTKPIWSPDGKEIAFSSHRDGSPDVLVKRSDGSQEAQAVWATPRLEHPEDWSSDGKYLVMEGGSPRTNSDLLYLRRKADGGWSEAVPYSREPLMQVGSQFSPNGRYLAYCSNESGRFEVYVRPFPEGEGKWQVSQSGGGQPRWSRDGTELYYVEGDTLVAVGVRMTPSFSSGSPERLFSDPGLIRRWPHPSYDVSADGERFLMVEPVGGWRPAAIRVVQNWYEEFRDRDRD